jgi:hypothetical protein
MRLIGTLLALAAIAAPVAAHAGKAPVVVELFTSEGCSSCPPADAVLTDLAQHQPDVLALAFHVTYWDYLGWKDPFGLPDATARQRAYAAAMRSDTVYTPQMVVDGQTEFVGSDKAAALSAIRAAAAKPVALRIARDGNQMSVSIGTGAGTARVLLVGYDVAHRTPVGRGENGGRTLLESNVVRSLTPIGAWSGAETAFHTPLPAGERVAVLLQTEAGRIIGAARLEE